MTQPAPMAVLPRRMVPARMTAPGAMTTSEPISTLRLRMSTPFAMWRSSTSSRWASAASSFAFAAASADVSIFCIEKNLLQNRLSQKLCRPLRKRKCCIQDRRNSERWKTNKNGNEFNGWKVVSNCPKTASELENPLQIFPILYYPKSE